MCPQANGLKFIMGVPLRDAEELQCLIDRCFGNERRADLLSIGENHGCLCTCATKELCLNISNSAPLAQLFTKLRYLRWRLRLAFVCERQEGNAKMMSGFATQWNQRYIGTERDGTKRRPQLTLDVVSDRDNGLECVGHAYDAQRRCRKTRFPGKRLLSAITGDLLFIISRSELA